jgi:hypothetical protein
VSRRRRYDSPPVRRIALTVALLALAVAPPALAETDPPPTIPSGVTIAGVPVGGLTEEDARAAVQAAFDQPLAFRHKTRTWSVAPSTLGARPRIGPALAAALAAPPDTAIRLEVMLNLWKIRVYGNGLRKTFNRAPRNSVVVLRDLRPYVTKAAFGVEVRRGLMETAIRGALARNERGPLGLRVRRIAPKVNRSNIGPVIVIRRESRRLELWRGTRFVRRFPIAVGMPAYPSPLGRFTVVRMEKNPTWNPPSSPWAAGLGPIPPGPGNPLGTRWIGTSAPGVGIHGTYASSSIGSAASHGCIRMYIRDVEWLYERVRLGTPVFFVRA